MAVSPTAQKIVDATQNDIDTMIAPAAQRHSNITDQASYNAAGEYMNTLKKQKKLITERKEDITKPLYKAYKSTMDLFKPAEQQIEQLTKQVQTAMQSFKREQDRIAAEKAQRIEDKIERGSISRPETIQRQMNDIGAISNTEAGVSEVKVRKVKFDVALMDGAYLLEVLQRDSVQAAFAVEIRKDALGNKAQGVEPRVEKGVEVYEEADIR